MASPFISGITKIFSTPDVAVDLGSANTRLFAGPGLLIDVPTISGSQTNARSNREPNQPIRAGQIRDLPSTARLLKKLFKAVSGVGLSGPRVVLSAAGGAGPAERAALVQAARLAGASATALIPAPLAAAIGAGLDVSLPYAQMIVDIGDGITDIAVIREGNIVYSRTAFIAGSHIRYAVQKMVRDRYDIKISNNDAELLIRKLGAADHGPPYGSLEVPETSSREGRTVTIDGRDVREAVVPVALLIAEKIAAAVRETPENESAEVVETGICLTGGVAALTRLAGVVEEITDLPVTVPPEPMYSVVKGAGRTLTTITQTNSWQNCSVHGISAKPVDQRFSF